MPELHAAGLTDELYSYDPAGNREDLSNASAYDYNENNYVEASPGHTYAHDDDGNRTATDPGQPDREEYTWDYTNQLRGYTRFTGGSFSKTASYLYDSFGRRIRKTVDGTSTWYLWDRDDLWGEYDAAGTRTRRYAYVGGWAPIEVADGATGSEAVYEVHTGHLNTPRILTDGAGSVVWRAEYQAFGATEVDEDPDGDLTAVSLNVRLPGQYYDAETGLHFNRFRYYDPRIGRYISADPIGQSGGLNVYEYSSTNPIGIVDPTGLDGVSIDVQNAIRKIRSLYEEARSLPDRVLESVARELSNNNPLLHNDPDGAIERMLEAAKDEETRRVLQAACEQVPEDWRAKESDSPGGVEFTDPKNDHNKIRVMPGNPNSRWESQWTPYVKDQRNGHPRDVYGNEVDDQTAESHIPAADFRYHP